MRKFAKYAVIGAISALIKFSLFSLCIGLFSMGYKVAATVGFLISAIFHFTANKIITFKNYDKRVSRQVIRYSVGAAVNYSATLILLTLFIDIGINHYIAMALTILTTMTFNYIMSNQWIFKQQKAFEK